MKLLRSLSVIRNEGSRSTCRLLTCLLLILSFVLGSRTTAAQPQGYVPADFGRPAHHYDDVPRGRIAIINSAVTGGFALVRSAIDGKVDSFSDAATVFAAGALGGYGFYLSKQLVGNGNTAPGLGLAYLSQSLVRNTSRGLHPVASLCAGPGPLDLCVDTGLEAQLGSGMRVEVNAVSTIATVVFPSFGMKPSFSGGYLFFTTGRDLGDRDDFIRSGFTVGRSAVVSTDALEITRRHEMIHVLQALQVGAVTPYLTLSQMRGRRTFFRLGRGAVEWDIQLDWLYFSLAGASAAFPYDRQWTEVEAYRLTAPPAPSEGPVLF